MFVPEVASSGRFLTDVCGLAFVSKINNHPSSTASSHSRLEPTLIVKALIAVLRMVELTVPMAKARTAPALHCAVDTNGLMAVLALLRVGSASMARANLP